MQIKKVDDSSLTVKTYNKVKEIELAHVFATLFHFVTDTEMFKVMTNLH
mgnify:CR=1 FL=1